MEGKRESNLPALSVFTNSSLEPKRLVSQFRQRNARRAIGRRFQWRPTPDLRVPHLARHIGHPPANVIIDATSGSPKRNACPECREIPYVVLIYVNLTLLNHLACNCSLRLPLSTK